MAGEVIRICPTGGVWGQVGVDVAPGIPPEALQCSANEWGSDTASFQLATPFGVNNLPIDALPGSPVEIERHGILGWSGFVEEVSPDNGQGIQTVQCKGWQYHLDDDMIRPLFVHRRLTEWKDWRSNLNADLTACTTGWGVEVGNGMISFRPPTSGIAGWPAGSAYVDLGPGAAAKRIILGWGHNVWSGTSSLYVRGSNNLSSWTTIHGPVNLGVANTSPRRITTTGYRYLSVYVDTNVNQAETAYVKVTSALAFGETAYESGDETAVKFDTVAKAVLASGALPRLSQATDGIEAFNFNIPELAPTERKTPRELLAIGQALHDCIVKVDVYGKLICRARPTAPFAEIGAWSQRAFRDGSTTREGVASGVYASGTGADGEQIEQLVDNADATLPTRQGYNKRNLLPIESSVTSTLITQLASVYLGNHQRSPFKGEQRVQGYGDVRDVLTGIPVHPFDCLLKTEEMLRFGDQIDPDTGGVGRDGRLKGVTYTAEDESGHLTIDNESRKFEALAGRVAALVGS